MSWFNYRDGRIEPVAEEPGWMGEDVEFDKATSAAGYVKVETCGTEGCFSLEVYEHADRPGWLFVFGWNRVYTVQVEGFSDYLDLLAKLAPIATAGLLADLSYTIEREIKTSTPAPHRPRRPLTEAAR